MKGGLEHSREAGGRGLKNGGAEAQPALGRGGREQL